MKLPKLHTAPKWASHLAYSEKLKYWWWINESIHMWSYTNRNDVYPHPFAGNGWLQISVSDLKIITINQQLENK